MAILVRNPQWAPKPLQPLYFAEFGNSTAADSLSPILPGDVRLEDLLVAVMPMPFSTAAQRHKLCEELIAAYNPAWQANGRPASAAELARRLDHLEARQQEQSQQILSLLAYLARLFEPQPVNPRRPMGFLPVLIPAGAGTTESES